MKFKTYLSLLSVILFNQTTMADSLYETFQGPAKLNLSLYVFAADIDGSINQADIQYNVNQPFKETVKELDHSYMAYVDLSKAKWGIYADRQYVKTSQQKQALHLPIALSSSLEKSSYGMYYQAYVSTQRNAKNQPKWVIEPSIGVHHTQAKAALGVLNKTIASDTSWNEFFWGSRLKYNFDTPWNIASELTFGADNTVSAQAHLGYRFAVMQRDLNLRVGYRYFEQDYRANDFHWDIRQHGPAVGINFPIF